MQQVDTIIHAGWIVPVEPYGAIYPQSALIINQGKTLDILPSNEVEKRYTSADTHSLGEHLLIPGFVNAHTHSAMSLFRGFADDIPLKRWLNDFIWPAEAQFVSDEFVRDGTELAIAEMIRGGTTCFNDMYFFPKTTAEVAEHSGMRATVGMILLDFPSAWASHADDYFAKGLELYESYRDHPLIKIALAPHAPYTVCETNLCRANALADQLDIQIHIHLHETAAEVEESLQQYGLRPIQRLKQMGLLSPRLMAIHMTQLTPAEISELASHGCHVIYCPASNLKLGSGFCPAPDLLAAGVNVALGTDSAASNNGLDMMNEMRLGALINKGLYRNPELIPAPMALQMATLNGAKALGIDHLTGSLIPDKMADVVAIDMGTLESQPVFNAISNLVYSTSRHQVTHSWIGGRQVLHERKLLTLDENQIRQKTQVWNQILLDAHNKAHGL